MVERLKFYRLTSSNRMLPLFLDVESEVLGDSKTVGIANFDVKCNGFSGCGCTRQPTLG